MKDKHKENYTQRIIFKHLENNDKKKYIESSQREKINYFQRNKSKT